MKNLCTAPKTKITESMETTIEAQISKIINLTKNRGKKRQDNNIWTGYMFSNGSNGILLKEISAETEGIASKLFVIELYKFDKLGTILVKERDGEIVEINTEPKEGFGENNIHNFLEEIIENAPNSTKQNLTKALTQ